MGTRMFARAIRTVLMGSSSSDSLKTARRLTRATVRGETATFEITSHWPRSVDLSGRRRLSD